MEKMILTVVSCDLYNDVWDVCERSLIINWKDIPYHKVLVTDNDNDYYSTFFDEKVIECEENWSKRLNKALDKIDSDYIFFMLEDQFPVEKVDNVVIENILNYMSDNDDIGVVYLENGVAGLGKSVLHNKWLRELSYGLPYRISCSPSIWRKKFLKTMTQHNYSAWEFEKIGSYDTVGQNNKVLELANSNWKRIDLAGAISRGKWTRNVPKYAESLGIHLDTKLRPMQSYKDFIYIKMRNFIFNINPILIVKIQNLLYKYNS